MSSPLLEAENLGKTYAIPVLEGVSLTLYPGEVLALAGENGAGKSTFSKIVCGLIRPTTGTMRLNGAPFSPVSRTDAEKKGVRMVMQELNLIPTLTVAENLMIDHLPRNRLGFIDRKALNAAAKPLMARVGLDAIDPATPVGELGVGHQQMVEIARNLAGNCRLLILDEPTAMLTDREVELLFEQIARLKAQGVGLIYISHRLDELKRIADRITVLRDGKLVSTQDIKPLSIDDIVKLMVGRDMSDTLDLGERSIGAPLLRVEHLGRGKAVQDVSFTLHSGEILGFAGLVGSGRTELMRLLFGADRKDTGNVFLRDSDTPLQLTSPQAAVRQGIAMIPEDRKQHGLLLPLPIALNTTLAWLKSNSRSGWLNNFREKQIAEKQAHLMATRCTSVDQAVGELSGGNQQKVVIGRWLHRDCPVILFDEPTRGIDIGAKFDIYHLMGDLSRQTKGMIVVSSDLRELMLVCDRIAVMSAGRLVRIFERGQWSQQDILDAAFSGYIGKDTAATPQTTASPA